MGMGHDDADEIVPPRLDEGGVGHDDLEPGHGLVGEGDAAVDHQPAATVAVEVEVHANLAGTAQRQEHQLVRAIRYLRRFQRRPDLRRAHLAFRR